MTFWEWLYKVGPGWPTERQWVTASIVVTLWIMLQAAFTQPKLWDVKLFEILIQGFALTGMLNMILAFHFSANKSDEKRAEVDEKKTDNTGKLADAITAVATGSNTVQDANAAGLAADTVADAAVDAAEQINKEK